MAAHQAPPSLGFSRQKHWSGLPLPSPMHESEKWKWSHSVVSDPQRPHGLQPSRLLHPWDFPGRLGKWKSSLTFGFFFPLFFSVYYQLLNAVLYYLRPLQYSWLENPMDGGAWWAAVHEVAKSRAWLSYFTFTFHFHALEKEMVTHSSILAWRIPGTGEPGGLPSMGSYRVGQDWSDLAVAVATLSLVHLPYVWGNCGNYFRPAAPRYGFQCFFDYPDLVLPWES